MEEYTICGNISAPQPSFVSYIYLCFKMTDRFIVQITFSLEVVSISVFQHAMIPSSAPRL